MLHVTLLEKEQGRLQLNDPRRQQLDKAEIPGTWQQVKHVNLFMTHSKHKKRVFTIKVIINIFLIIISTFRYQLING